LSVAVIILNWNGKDILAKFLPSVVKHSQLPDVSVYLADNGSNDDSVGYVEKNFPTVRIIQLDKNYGFADGYNKAMEHIYEEYAVLLNSDVEVTENWLIPLMDYMNHHPETVACQPKILSYQQKDHFEYAGAAGGYIDRYGFPFCRGRFFNVFEEDKGQYNTVDEIFWATGACMFIRTETFREMGGMDNKFFAHMEEIDLCWRIWARGYSIVYVPESKVYHVGGATLNKTNPHKTFLNFRNNLYLLYKNEPSHLFYIFIIRYILDFIAFLKFIASFEGQNAMSVLRAHAQFIKNRKKFKPKRKENLSKTVVNNIPTIYRHSIVLDFFIRGKKYFYQLSFRK